jgi:hypothetical protein
MWPRIVLLTMLLGGCVPISRDMPSTTASLAAGASLTLRQNYQTAHRNAVEFARSCYERGGMHVVEERLDPERHVGEINVLRQSNPEPVGKVTLEEVDSRTSIVTTRFSDPAWASHGLSFEAAAMGATAACRVP